MCQTAAEEAVSVLSKQRRIWNHHVAKLPCLENQHRMKLLEPEDAKGFGLFSLFYRFGNKHWAVMWSIQRQSRVMSESGVEESRCSSLFLCSAPTRPFHAYSCRNSLTPNPFRTESLGDDSVLLSILPYYGTSVYCILTSWCYFCSAGCGWPRDTRTVGRGPVMSLSYYSRVWPL